MPERASLAPRMLGLWLALERGSDFIAQFSDSRHVLRRVMCRALCLALLLHELENLARGDKRGDRGRSKEDCDEQRAVPACTPSQSALGARSVTTAEIDESRRPAPHSSSESASASSCSAETRRMTLRKRVMKSCASATTCQVPAAVQLYLLRNNGSPIDDLADKACTHDLHTAQYSTCHTAYYTVCMNVIKADPGLNANLQQIVHVFHVWPVPHLYA